MADEAAQLLAGTIIGGEHTIHAARNDGLAIGGEAIGAVIIAVGRAALDGCDHPAIPCDVENGVTAIITAFAVIERPAILAGDGTAEGAGLRLRQGLGAWQGVRRGWQSEGVFEGTTIID